MSTTDKCPHCGGPALTLQPGRRPLQTLDEGFEELRENGGTRPPPSPEMRPCYCDGARVKAHLAAWEEIRKEVAAELENERERIRITGLAPNPLLVDMPTKPAGPGPYRVELKTKLPGEDWTARTVSRFRAYRDDHPSWGSLHIALEDGNLDDHNVRFCADYAAELGDAEGHALALILRGMNEGQREYLMQALEEPEGP